MLTTEVLAKAKPLTHNVIAVTNGTSPLGTIICEHAANAGASVFALDTNATSLAQQAISFRQNNLRLRGIPCDLTSETSMLNAVQEIVNHAPPIDFWVHAEVMAPADLHKLSAAMLAFGHHFDMRGKGSLLLIGDQPPSQELESIIPAQLTMKKFMEKAKVNIVISNMLEAPEIAKKAILRLTQD